MLPCLRRMLCGLTLSVGLAAHAQAVEFQSVTFISSTLGVNSNHLCVGAPMGAKTSDIGCPTYSPYVNPTNGNVGIGTTAPSTTLTVSGTTYTRDLHLELWPGAAVPVSVSVASGAESDPQVGTLTSGKWCTTDGTAVNCTSDEPTSGASVAGADTQVQFNDGGSTLGADSGLTFNKTTDELTVAGRVSTTKVVLANGSVDTCSDGSPVGTFRINPTDGHPEVCRPN